MVPVDELSENQTTTVRDAEEAAELRVEESMEEYDVPAPLEPWAYATVKKRGRMLEVLQTVRDYRIGKYADPENYCSVKGSTAGNYVSTDGELAGCIVKDPETCGYDLTPIGEKALEVPWSEVAP